MGVIEYRLNAIDQKMDALTKKIDDGTYVSHREFEATVNDLIRRIDEKGDKDKVELNFQGDDCDGRHSCSRTHCALMKLIIK